MRTINKILLGFLLPLMFVSCEREYDAPPLTEPTYNGSKANITIAELKELYASASTEVVINDDYILKAWIAGNDESGNIYKQVIIQDETGGISIGVDEGSVYNTYRVGQEVYLQLNGMCVYSYGGELQLGYPGAYLNRTPWEDFQKHVLLNGWPDKNKVVPLIVNDFSKLDAIAGEVAFTVVKLNNVSFTNGGKNTFAPEGAYGSETLTDAKGNTMVVRTSSYASFAGTKLPIGKGSVIGILGRYNGSWQLTIRTAEDVLTFDGTTSGGSDTPGTTPDNPGTDTPDTDTPTVDGTSVFKETFGSSVDKGADDYWPGVNAYTGWSSASLQFSDPAMTGTFSNASIRKTSILDPHVWFAATKDSKLKIAGFSTSGYTTLTLTYSITANGDGADQSTIKVYCDDTEITVPAKAIATTNTYQTVTLTGIAAGCTSITFSSEAATNTAGYRIDTIELVGK